MFNSDKCECAASCYHECICDWVVKKEWQGLSDEERYLNEGRSPEEIEFARAIEAKLREKNDG